MKKVILATAIFLLAYTAQSQVISGVRPDASQKEGEFSEWKNLDVSFDDGTNLVIQYRVGFMKRKVIGCHYEIEIKNTSAEKLNIKLKSSYYDKLVKRNFGDEIKETLKPEKSFTGHFVAQGCKKEKGLETNDDAALCFACDFGISIYVSKK